MHRAIGALFHGLIDYLTVIILVIGPRVAGFAGHQATLCYALAVIHLLLTLITRFPLGPFKLVSFVAHGLIELLVSLLLIVLPWISNFSAGVLSRNFFVGMGIIILIVFALTDYRGLRAPGRRLV
jgi:hypothetical protein